MPQPDGAPDKLAPARVVPRTLPLARLEIAALVVFVTTRFIGYASSVDIHPEDETYYLLYGEAFLQRGSLPPVAWSPAYCVLAGLAGFVAPAGSIPADVLFQGLLTGGAIAVWWALRPLVAAPLNLLAAAWWVCLPLVLNAERAGQMAVPHVYVAAGIGMFVVVGLLVRGKYRTAALAGCVMTVVRSESMLWIAGVAVLLWLLRATRRRRGVAVMFTIAAVIGLTTVASWSVRNRAWTAFRQHYAAHRMQDELDSKTAAGIPIEGDVPHGLLVSEAFNEPDAIVERDFPGSTSVPTAALAAPGHFLSFVFENLGAMPRALAIATLPYDVSYWVGIAVLAAAGIGWWRWSRDRRRWVLPDPFVAVAVLAAPLSIVSSLWVAPRPELLWPLHLPVFLLVLGGVSALVPAAAVFRRRLVLTAAAAILGLSLLWPGPFAASQGEPMYREEIRLMQQAELPSDARVLCSLAQCFEAYVRGSDVQWLQMSELDQSAADVGAFFAQHEITHVALDSVLHHLLGRVGDFRAELEGTDWRLVGERGSSRLFERRPR